MRAELTSPLEPTIGLAAAWLSETAARCGCASGMSFNVLRAMLHALRDRLPDEEAAAVA